MELTPSDLARVGELLLNATATASMLGHVSPAMSLVYIDPGDDPLEQFVHDVLASQADPDARSRAYRFVDDAGWPQAVVAAITK